MIKFTSERAFIALAFATTLGASLAALPLLLDSALAVDAGGDKAAQGEHQRPLPSEMIEARLAYIKTALKITDAQSKQWNALADLMRKQAKDRDAAITARRDGPHDANLSVIDRLEMRQKMMANAAEHLSALIAAARPLYATFSDEQKQVADELLMRLRFGGRDGFRHP